MGVECMSMPLVSIELDFEAVYECVTIEEECHVS